jgi:hypothetical protein
MLKAVLNKRYIFYEKNDFLFNTNFFQERQNIIHFRALIQKIVVINNNNNFFVRIMWYSHLETLFNWFKSWYGCKFYFSWSVPFVHELNYMSIHRRQLFVEFKTIFSLFYSTYNGWRQHLHISALTRAGIRISKSIRLHG